MHEVRTYIVKGAAVLRNRVERPAKCAKRAAIYAVTVRRSDDVRPSTMDGGMDHESGSVEEADGSSVNDFAGVVDLDQVRSLDQGEGNAEGIHPEGFRINGVLDVARISRLSSSSTGRWRRTRTVIWPATPSSNPYFPNILNAAASLPFKYARSLCLSSNFGGAGKAIISPRAFSLDSPGSSVACASFWSTAVPSELLKVAWGGAIVILGRL